HFHLILFCFFFAFSLPLPLPLPRPHMPGSRFTTHQGSRFISRPYLVYHSAIPRGPRIPRHSPSGQGLRTKANKASKAPGGAGRAGNVLRIGNGHVRIPWSGRGKAWARRGCGNPGELWTTVWNVGRSARTTVHRTESS
ncbi:hypothetical protein CLAIMM_11071 isoform 1, partial [Cladophialophora immunda]